MRSMIAAVSVLACIPPALAQESGNWWNPALDPNFKLGHGGNVASLEAVRGYRPRLSAETSRDAITLWQFVLGQFGAAADGIMPAWQTYAIAENCTAGLAIKAESGKEFGDSAKVKASLESARARFKAWAAAQPSTLTLYSDAVLGPWAQDSGLMPLTYSHNWSTLKQPYMRPNGTEPPILVQGVGPNIDMSVNYNGAFCSTQAGTWSGMYTEVRTGITMANRLPGTLTVSREAAQAFVARNPSRTVRLEIQVAPVGRGDRINSPWFVKAVTIKHMTVRGSDGGVLADITL